MSGLEFIIPAGCGFVLGGGIALMTMLFVPAKGDSEAEITSLRATIDDARAEIARLSAEKHARDVALRNVIEAAESLHRQGERG